MTDRHPARGILRRQRTTISRLHGVLSDAIETTVARLPGDGTRPATQADRAAIMAEVRRGLGILYGHAPGASVERSAVYQVTVNGTEAARLLPVQASVKRWREVLDDATRTAVEDEALT